MHFNKKIKIGSFEISRNSKVFIIAEAGINHGGDMRIANKLIDLACEAGADAVKFQTFKAEHLILKNVKKAGYQLKTTNSEESQFEMLRKLEVTKEQNIKLKKYCKKRKIIFLTTPFDEYSLESVNGLDLSAYKIASTDLTNLPFLRKVAKKGKPIILSTGMSYLKEIRAALKEIYHFNKDVILLQCTANYPIMDEEANLNVINTFKKYFDVLLGYSDHSVGVGAAPYAVAMGAKVIEKHFTLSKKFEGPDHKASLNPAELKKMIKQIRQVEKYLGSDVKIPTASENKNRMALQKCLVASKFIQKGKFFKENNLIAKRTGGVGISPIYYHDVLGMAAPQDFSVDECIHL